MCPSTGFSLRSSFKAALIARKASSHRICIHHVVSCFSSPMTTVFGGILCHYLNHSVPVYTSTLYLSISYHIFCPTLVGFIFHSIPYSSPYYVLFCSLRFYSNSNCISNSNSILFHAVLCDSIPIPNLFLILFYSNSNCNSNSNSILFFAILCDSIQFPTLFLFLVLFFSHSNSAPTCNSILFYLQL